MMSQLEIYVYSGDGHVVQLCFRSVASDPATQMFRLVKMVSRDNGKFYFASDSEHILHWMT